MSFLGYERYMQEPPPSRETLMQNALLRLAPVNLKEDWTEVKFKFNSHFSPNDTPTEDGSHLYVQPKGVVERVDIYTTTHTLMSHRIPPAFNPVDMVITKNTRIHVGENFSPSLYELEVRYSLKEPHSDDDIPATFLWKAEVAIEPGACLFDKPTTKATVSFPKNGWFTRLPTFFHDVEFTSEGIRGLDKHNGIVYSYIRSLWSEAGFNDLPENHTVESMSTLLMEMIRMSLANPKKYIEFQEFAPKFYGS